MSQPASDDIHQHSGWLIPLAFMGAIALLCAGFLVYYLRPGPRDGAPTGDMKIVFWTSVLTFFIWLLTLVAMRVQSARAERELRELREQGLDAGLLT